MPFCRSMQLSMRCGGYVEIEEAHLSPGSVVAVMLSLCLLFIAVPVSAKDLADAARRSAGAGASDPLAKTNKTDLKWTHLNEDGVTTNLWWIKGIYDFAKWGKLSYELTYAKTDDAGMITQGWDNLSLKPLFFFGKGNVGYWKYGLATGFELVLDFAEVNTGRGTLQGYGSGSDLFSPIVGISFKKRNTILTSTVQHYADFSGDQDVSVTAFHLVAIRKFDKGFWTKMDIVVPYDWNKEAVPGNIELELGRMITSFFGVYGSGLAGFADSTLDWGASLNVRFIY